ncbi:hypothetical protein LMG27952_00627 [Paraburkholderia hiiakae]|uniref:Uncharacterized protein n=1 Tax=Paraburkholderia hiiakae TaxID=1081782 RepID=A0ABM8NB34_9BURK|nr:hypothetical protein [Paraburkholderia hiiakae]CAD6512761.1 hypothetical protein LMG27952_00627 [Paraburkholderia hiiakae]
MTQCFKDHACDDLELHKNTTALAECESYFTEENGRKVKITEVPVLTCACIWREYQKEAEDIVAPGGTLIADPKIRNRAINAAYAKLWLSDPRFQWAGLAAFASKQVGCGLLHAADSIKKIQAEHDAAQRMAQSSRPSWGIPGLLSVSKVDEIAQRNYEQARRSNPVPSIDVRRDGDLLSLAQQQYQHMYDMLALGNTTLFLDVFPLHAFYKKRGLSELKVCLRARQRIVRQSPPVLWPIVDRLPFGWDYPQILQAFEAIDSGYIAESVVYLAQHEQINILQPAMYGDPQLVALLRADQASYVTGFPSGVAEAIELTLTSQCGRIDDGRSISFSRNPAADLSDANQRMPFVLKAAARFDEMLHNANRSLVEQSIQDIAAGQGVR